MADDQCGSCCHWREITDTVGECLARHSVGTFPILPLRNKRGTACDDYMWRYVQHTDTVSDRPGMLRVLGAIEELTERVDTLISILEDRTVNIKQ